MSFGETEHWSCEDALKNFQAIDRRQHYIGRARQSVVLYGENRGKEPAGRRDDAQGSVHVGKTKNYQG